MFLCTCFGTVLYLRTYWNCCNSAAKICQCYIVLPDLSSCNIFQWQLFSKTGPENDKWSLQPDTNIYSSNLFQLSPKPWVPFNCPSVSTPCLLVSHTNGSCYWTSWAIYCCCHGKLGSSERQVSSDEKRWYKTHYVPLWSNAYKEYRWTFHYTWWNPQTSYRCCSFSGMDISFLILWFSLCLKLDDGSASAMRSSHLISITNFIADLWQ